jgi:serine/threonine protein kinase
MMPNVVTSQSERFKWTKEGLISEGSFGKIFCGIDRENKRNVTIKVGSRYDLKAEARFLESLFCDHIERLVALDVFYEKNVSVKVKRPKDILVTELYNGSTLADMMEKDIRYKNGLPDSSFLNLLISLNSALSFLRTKGISHRNITINNIVSHTSQFGEFKFVLINFGMATTEIKVPTEPSEQFTCVGAAEFLPLDLYAEYILGKKDVNKMKLYLQDVELYMLGVTLFYAATGTYPFQPFEYRTFSDCHFELTECHRTWFDMMSKKPENILWMCQKSTDGRYEEHDSLPDNIPMTKSLRIYVEKLLHSLLSPPNNSKFDLFHYQSTQISSLAMIDLYNVGQPDDLLRLYLPELDLSNVKQYVDESEETLFGGWNDRVLFFYRGSYLHPDVPVSHKVPLYEVSGLRFNAPVISYVQLSSLEVLEETGAIELNSFDREDFLEEMKCYLNFIHSCVEQVPTSEEFTVFTDTLTGVLDLIMKEASSTLRQAKNFIDHVDTMVKFCSHPVNKNWAKLLQFYNRLKGLLSTYQSYFFGKDAAISKISLVQNPPANYKTRMEKILKDCNEIVKMYENDEELSNNVCTTTHQKLCSTMSQEAGKLLDEAKSQHMRIQREVHSSLKKCVSCFERLSEFQETVERNKKLMDELLDSLSGTDRMTQQSAIQSINLSGQLLNLLKNGQNLSHELSKLENKLGNPGK